MNELSIIFDKINLDINEILDAAETKWNFLPFRPGLVGGHCIGVDPYYLTYISKQNNYSPKVILSGRSINDKMSTYLSNKFIKLLRVKKIELSKSNILILGASFKENCSDIRNSKVFDIYKNLSKYKAKVSIFDLIVDKNEVYREYKINLIESPKKKFYDGIIIAVSHKYFTKMGLKKIKSFTKDKSIILDIKNCFKGLIKNV